MIRVIDSHTEGEPTRVVISGGPDLGPGSLVEKRDRFRSEFDAFRTTIVGEPRSSEAAVGALLCEPEHAGQAAGVIYFDNGGVLDMCVHGTIGLMATLAHLGRITPGEHLIGTPVGEVRATWHGEGRTSVANVASERYASGIEVAIDAERTVTGDIAWGGNWFYLCADHGLPLGPESIDALTRIGIRIRKALKREGITGRDGAEIRHVILMGPASSKDHSDGRHFVLCPGGEYDRSPCGTGTSAKIACLAAEGRLAPGDTWRQESVIGTVFQGRYEPLGDGRILPIVTGRAWINGDVTILIDPADPFRHGIPRAKVF